MTTERNLSEKLDKILLAIEIQTNALRVLAYCIEQEFFIDEAGDEDVVPGELLARRELTLSSGIKREEN